MNSSYICEVSGPSNCWASTVGNVTDLELLIHDNLLVVSLLPGVLGRMKAFCLFERKDGHGFVRWLAKLVACTAVIDLIDKAPEDKDGLLPFEAYNKARTELARQQKEARDELQGKGIRDRSAVDARCINSDPW